MISASDRTSGALFRTEEIGGIVSTHHHSHEWKVYRIVMAGILVGAFVVWAMNAIDAVLR